jgi:hypothetical protein
MEVKAAALRARPLRTKGPKTQSTVGLDEEMFGVAAPQAAGGGRGSSAAQLAGRGEAAGLRPVRGTRSQI